MAKYIKKPIEVEAVKFVGDFASYNKVCEITGLNFEATSMNSCGVNSFVIDTFKGKLTVTPGDYVVKNNEGEIYLCKPDMFEKTYMRRENIGEITDGSHSFDELYYHRMILFSIICNGCSDKACKSWKHNDNTMFDNYFIVGIDTPKGQYSYHYHKDYWDLFDVKEIEFAPVWDGHQPKDVTRLLSL